MDKENSPLKQIRTFQGDVAEALKTQNESVVSIQRKEQAKKSLEPEIEKNIKSERKKILLLILGILVLTSLGGLGGWYAYTEFINKTKPPLLDAPPNRLISSAIEVNLDTTDASRESLLVLISEEKFREDIPDGEIKHMVLRTGTSTPRVIISTQELLRLLESRAPGPLVRSFDPVFMLGSIGEETPSTFLLIKLASFENAFAGMLNWESNLSSDLSTLFGVEEFGETTWRDMVINNKDTRAIVDEVGEERLLYSFFDNELLIITTGREALEIIITRLNREKLIR